MAVQASLCLTWSETKYLGFLKRWLVYKPFGFIINHGLFHSSADNSCYFEILFPGLTLGLGARDEAQL